MSMLEPCPSEHRVFTIVKHANRKMLFIVGTSRQKNV